MDTNNSTITNEQDKESVMLSTLDNPFNPFIDYDHWLAFDREKGYYTNEFLARMVVTSPSFSDEQQEQDINDAIDSIVDNNVLGIYIKVTRDFKPKPIDISKFI
jgi:hypothetical protein